ncbi:MAG: LytTR family DNA-binding domain-containing protein [Polymorphobacter sp.]|uniref:LytTR family DNA-binding domain-containing protein n=1 Tax=Polymorphobacter sp. TaxID=1909290 RepID=UPI003A8C4D90
MGGTGHDQRDWLRVVLLPPLVIGLAIGLGQFGNVRFENRLVHVLYGMVSLMFSWLVMEAGSALSARAVRPLRLPLWVPLLGGVVLAGLLHAPFTVLRDGWFTPYLRDGSAFFRSWPWAFDDPTYRTESLLALANRAVVWLTFNYVLVRWLGMARFGYQDFFRVPGLAAPVAAREPAEAGDDAPVASGIALLLQKLPPQIGRDIICLKAQEHYTEVVTRLGRATIYMRFSDAVALASGAIEGARIHRSYWVAQAAVDGLERDGGKTMLRLAGGELLPVSRTYLHQLSVLSPA